MGNKKGVSGKRNRQVGNNLEVQTAKKYQECGYEHVGTCRNLGGRKRDAEKIDLMNKDEFVNGKFPFNVQCKHYARSLDYYKLLSELPQDGYVNVIHHTQTKKVNKNFITIGKYVMLNEDDWFDIIKRLKEYENGKKI